MYTLTEFGKQLIITGDLDPVYIMLHKAIQNQDLTYSQLCAWSLTYWCCYHSGVACYVTQHATTSASFWEHLSDIAENRSRRWPRGTERRHFRGVSARKTIQALQAKHQDAEAFIASVRKPTFSEVSTQVRNNTGFGIWVTFKIADMLERVFRFPVDFSDAELYEAPLQGVERFCLMNHHSVDTDFVLKHLSNKLRGLTAPPENKRALNIQEYETILCKWKSHTNGHYPMGKDTIEIAEGLHGFGELATKLSHYLPEHKKQNRLL